MTLAAPAASEPAALRPSLPVQAAAPVALALLAFATTAFLPAILADGDTWSHVATGDWILAIARPARRSILVLVRGRALDRA